MKPGKIKSVKYGPERDVEILIGPEELYSEISEPSGIIRGKDVTSCEILEELNSGRLHIHLYLWVGEKKIKFYTGETKVDICLLLDELEASLGDFPRTWKN